MEWFAVGLLAAAMATSLAQSAAQELRLDSIEPPDWFVELPDPMLLVRGEGLEQAKFSIRAEGVTLVRSQASANGHWAFLWLKTGSARPQSVDIVATRGRASVTRAFPLQARREAAEAHRGISPSDVIYLAMTDRFADGDEANDDPASAPGGFNRGKARGWHGGDFAGLGQHLDYLEALGVTALWTTPVYDNGAMPESYHGYAATNLYGVDAHFGTMEDYRRLSAGLHARGMKLMIDLVPNHIGVQHPWVKDPPMPDWFHGTLAEHTRAEGNFHQLIDPHAAPRSWRKLTEGWFTDGMPDMNQENPLVAQYLIQNALWWVEAAQIDGIRIDTFPYVGREFWQKYHGELHRAFPNLTTVGEVFDPDPRVTSFFAGGRSHAGIDTGLDTPFDFPVYFALRETLAHGKSMQDLAAVLAQDGLYAHPERLIHFFGNHDTTRFLTEARGSMARWREAVGLMATLRGTPQLYSGDELGMEGGEDPDNRRDFPGGFAGESVASGFAAATRTAEQQAAFSWTSGLLLLRRSEPALQGGAQQDFMADETTFVYLRSERLDGCDKGQAHEAVLAAVNTSAESRDLTLPFADTGLAGCTRFTPLAPANTGKALVVDGAVHLTIPGDTIVLFGVR